MSEFKPPKVMIGMPCGKGTIPWATAMSLMNTIRACDKEGVPIMVESVVGCAVVQWARSITVKKFLQSKATHLFWIDDDIVWTVEDFFQILGFGRVLEVVGATYPFKRDGGGFLVNLAGEPNEREVNGLGCVKIKSMGLGFTLMQRAVVEKVAAGKPRVWDQMNGIEYADVFRVDRSLDAPQGGDEAGAINIRAANGPRGEDIAFFHDIGAAGYDVWLDPSITLGHVGVKVYRGDVIDALGMQDYAKETKSQ